MPVVGDPFPDTASENDETVESTVDGPAGGWRP